MWAILFLLPLWWYLGVVGWITRLSLLLQLVVQKYGVVCSLMGNEEGKNKHILFERIHVKFSTYLPRLLWLLGPGNSCLWILKRILEIQMYSLRELSQETFAKVHLEIGELVGTHCSFLFSFLPSLKTCTHPPTHTLSLSECACMRIFYLCA